MSKTFDGIRRYYRPVFLPPDNRGLKSSGFGVSLAAIGVVIFASALLWHYGNKIDPIMVAHPPSGQTEVFEKEQQEVLSASVVEKAIEEPTRIYIENIGVEAAVAGVGLTAKGAMAMPEGTDTVGWYNLGNRPGEAGSAVLTGHFDTLLSQPAVFAKIGLLAQGDVVKITDRSGTILDFTVTRVVSYPYQELPLDEIFARDDGKYLNLITCGGKWSWKKGNYSERTVVYTEKLEPEITPVLENPNLVL